VKAIGALQELEKSGFWKLTDIQSIYATSAGSVASVLISLGFDWDAINDYLVLRPWNEEVYFTPMDVLDSFHKKGIFGKELFYMFYKPFFDAKDISMEITMKQFYEYTHIELHFFSLEVNEFKIHDISYLTYPDIELIEAVRMSSSIPTVFSPIFLDGKCFVDGAVLNNYPVVRCLERFPGSEEEILGIKQIYEDNNQIKLQEEDTMLDFIFVYVNRLFSHIDTETENAGKIKYELSYSVPSMGFQQFKEAICSVEVRRGILEDGRSAGLDFLSKLRRKGNASEEEEK
jgi:predicted acylesterase/phospholipase RssA